MVASRTEIPEFTLTREIDMTAALALRRQLAEAGHRVSVNDLVVKAAALALCEHPALNASWGGDHVVHHGHVSVGIAVAAEGVLLVPVIADADRKSLPEIGVEARALGERARTRTASPAELSGATFTVTNLGMLGVLSFTAVIDAPQVAILAAGAVVRGPVFGDDGAVVACDLMQVSLTCDHRAVYGADGARFLQRLAELLEHPTLLLLPPLGAANERDER
jgi:pyruvate dehydrogenase E2 component (dihydrolipoamide acetyltransferase)